MHPVTDAGAVMTAFPMAAAMARYGRRAGFVIGGALGLVGSGLCLLAARSRSFALLLVGSLMFGTW